MLRPTPSYWIGSLQKIGTEAVKEFIETDGALPKSIEWIANRDLPPNTFPEPHAKVRPIYEKNVFDYPAHARDSL
jgi:hypothetical protein